MTPAPQELEPAQLQQVRAIAEQAAINPEKFKEDVKTLTEGQLNVLADIFLQEKRAQLSQAVKLEIKSRLDSLDAETVGEGLEDLLRRIPKVREVLAVEERTHTQDLYRDLDTASSSVKDVIGGAYDYVRLNVVKPVADRTKDMFIIGPVLGAIADMSPHHIKNAVSRKFYQLLSTFGSDTATSSLFGKTLSKIGDGARQKLALMDVSDVVEEYREEKKAGENIEFVEQVTPDEWRKMKEALQKNPRSMADRAAAVISERRKGGATKIRILTADLLRTEAEVQEQVKTEQTEQMKTTLLALPAWKDAGVKAVSFSTEETSTENGSLKITQTDIDEVGNPKPDTPAFALLETMKTFTNAGKIVISKDQRDAVTFSWNAPKTLTLPRVTSANLGMLNEIAGKPQPDKFSTLEITQSDDITSEEVKLLSRTVNSVSGNVLVAENNPKVLDAILNRKMSNITQDPPAKYTLDSSGDFMFLSPAMPVSPSA